MTPDLIRRPAGQTFERHPRLSAPDIRDRSGLVPGRVTWWTWTGVAGPARAAKLSTELDAVLIELDGGAPQRIEVTREVVKNRTSFRCPTCARTCRHLHENGGRFSCRFCCGLGYYHRSPDGRRDLTMRLARLRRRIEKNRLEHDKLMRAVLELNAEQARRIEARTRRVRREVECDYQQARIGAAQVDHAV
jgi:hypothetical protein